MQALDASKVEGISLILESAAKANVSGALRRAGSKVLQTVFDN